MAGFDVTVPSLSTSTRNPKSASSDPHPVGAQPFKLIVPVISLANTVGGIPLFWKKRMTTSLFVPTRKSWDIAKDEIAQLIRTATQQSDSAG